MSLRGGRRALFGLLIVLGALPSGALAQATEDHADQWLPSSDGATWTYRWSDSAYAQQPTLERYSLSSRTGQTFKIDWTTSDLGNGEGTTEGAGRMDYSRSNLGLLNTNWIATPPPPQFPILCSDPTGCPNSLAGTHFMLIWGSRTPVIQEPLLQRMRWTSRGGAENDVASDNRYLGMERVSVPAFPEGVRSARIQSEITQAGAIGDPYGSGTRTVWWVYGVGPVKIEFRHTAGEVGTSELMSTNLVPKPAPPDENYFPLIAGERQVYRWRNSRHMRRASTQRLSVGQVLNGTARVEVESLRGPIALAGTYLLATRTTGVTNIAGHTRSRTRTRFPRLGRRRRLLTPIDFLVFGYNPVLPAHPTTGQEWAHRRGSRDFGIFGVEGETRVRGFRRVRTPAGRFRALLVESKLTQRGHRYGSGRRLSYFAPGRGLVKLVFRHRDRSVSTVELVR